eukprot:scaffold1574_cov119-Isochrysis_galbana.AAC.12
MAARPAVTHVAKGERDVCPRVMTGSPHRPANTWARSPARGARVAARWKGEKLAGRAGLSAPSSRQQGAGRRRPLGAGAPNTVGLGHW